MREAANRMMFLDFAPTEEGAIKGWLFGAGVLLQRVGKARFSEGVKRAMAELRKFPKPNELSDLIPDAPETTYCGKCTEGFVYDTVNGRTVVRDCQCHPRRRDA